MKQLGRRKFSWNKRKSSGRKSFGIQKTFKPVLYVALLALLFVSGRLVYVSPFFNLSQLQYQYEGDSAYVETLKKDILKITEREIGHSLWKIDIYSLEREIKKLNWVNQVSLQKKFPNEILIYIQPKKVMANILKTPTKIIPVAEDATLLEETGFKTAPLVPILSNKNFRKDLDLRKRALQLLKEIPQEGSFSYSQISEVSALSNDDFKILLKGVPAEVLINNENVPLKSERISKVIDYLDEKEMRGRVIDSGFYKKVLVRPRNHR